MRELVNTSQLKYTSVKHTTTHLLFNLFIDRHTIWLKAS